MPLSNSALLDELIAAAGGDLSLAYRAIAETPGETIGIFRDKAKDMDKVKAKINDLKPA